jgi:hypothetical protein
MRGLAKILGDTDHWRSQWTLDALQLQNTTIQTIIQASMDYDRLASHLYKAANGNCTNEKREIS